MSYKFRGMDHIGITIPDIEAATRFLVEAFDAEPIYDSVKRTDPAVEGSEPEDILQGHAVLPFRSEHVCRDVGGGSVG